MPQFKIPPSARIGELIILTPEESHHVRNVFRLQRGATVQLFDGTGRSFLGRIDEVGKSVRVFLEKEFSRPLPPQKIILWQGLLKGEKMDWVIGKVTELGVTELHPFSSSRSIVKITEKDKTSRWQKIADASAKQCGRANQLTVLSPKRYETIWGEKIEGTKIFCWEEAKTTLRSVTLEKSETIHLIVGPEGGFSSEEAEQAKAQGWQIIGLGPLILRSETASLVVIAQIQYELQNSQ